MLGTPPPLDAVKAFTAENKMDWTQIVEGKGWQSDIGRRYRVYAIPFTCLVDRHGKVIGMNLRGQALADAVAKAVGAPGISLK